MEGTFSNVLVPVPLAVGVGMSLFISATDTGLSPDEMTLPANFVPVAGLKMQVYADPLAQLPLESRNSLKSPERIFVVGSCVDFGEDWVRWKPS